MRPFIDSIKVPKLYFLVSKGILASFVAVSKSVRAEVVAVRAGVKVTGEPESS